MVALGNDVKFLIVSRTLSGRDAMGALFVPYSTRPTYISPHYGAGLRLAPKGGRRAGRTTHYSGGYQQYKLESRGAGALPLGGAMASPTAEVDLTLSGQLLRGIHVAQASDEMAVLQTSDATVAYASGVEKRRPFMGVSPAQMPVLVQVLERHFTDYLRRAGYV